MKPLDRTRLLQNLQLAGLTEDQYNQIPKECAIGGGGLHCYCLFRNDDPSCPILDVVEGKFAGILCSTHKREVDEIRAEKALRKKKQLYLDLGSRVPQSKREAIPQKVRNEVWIRDGGKCATCGSREKLEFDHIVAVSKGGSNTTRNVELLCQVHNRKKSDNI